MFKSEKFGYVLLFAWALLFIAWIGNFLGLDKNSWAAWVQAIGSIAAIFATGAFFLVQRREERKKDEDNLLLKNTRSAQRAQAVAFWSLEAMRDAIASREGGGPSNGLPFRPERLDHFREMMERIAETTEDYAVTQIALAVCNKLNEAYNDYVCFQQQYFDIYLDAMARRVNETQSMYDRMIAYQNKLEEQCAKRGIHLGNTEME